MQFHPSSSPTSDSLGSSRIQRLAPCVAERIAAGEVIERPSSVVKELIENSIDAQATEIEIRLQQGGKDLIEIIDNGLGMTPQDLELCIERHTTSKLSELEDLEKISTLGFRGEALSSIAAVTDFEILSRHQDSNSTYQLKAGDLSGRLLDRPRATEITFGHFNHTSHGTRIQARGLFSQIPARLKFLKSQGAEVSQIRDWVERLAIAHPQIGFHLLSEDRSVLRLPASSETERVRTILSDGDDFPLKSASTDQDGFRDRGLRLRIHWLQGLSSPQSRKLIQIVNGRAVRDRVLQQALLNPFRQLLLPGQFPAVVLYVEVNPAALDVNVHPTKTEVRFLDSRKLFAAVDGLVKKLVARDGAPAFATSWSAADSESTAPLYSSPSFSPTTIPWTQKEPVIESVIESVVEPIHDYQQVPFLSMSSAISSPSAAPLPTLLSDARWVGILFQTYLVYEAREELILVDQHAAHERIRYEKLRQRILRSPEASSVHSFSSQALLIPEVIHTPSEKDGLLRDRLPWILQLGFEAEVFGENSVVFRAVPAEWGLKQIPLRLKNLMDRLLHLETPSASPETLLLDESLFEALASEACHSAIRAGDALDLREGQELVRLLFDCQQPWNCPHGRPTVVKLPQRKLEEWFFRKV